MTKIIFLLALLLATFLSSAFAQSKCEILFFEGKYQEAIDLINTEIENGKGTINEYLLAAKSEENLYDFEAAVWFYDRAITIDPKSIIALEGKARSYINLGQKKDALNTYQIILDIDSSLTRIQGKKADLLMDLDRYEQSEVLFSRLYEADSSNVYFLRKLIQVRHKLNQFGYILGLYWDNPYFPESNNELIFFVANSYLKINEVPNALELLYGILKNDSLYTLAIGKIASIQFGNYRNYEEAVLYYRKLNELENNRNPLHLKNQAICEYFTGNQEFASIALDSLSQIIDGDPIVPFYAGLAYKKLGNVDKSLEFLEKAADEIIPSYTSDIYHHLGRAYASKRMFKEAIGTYKKVQEYDPENYQVLYDLAVTYEEYNLNRTVAYTYYQQFVKECTNQKSVDLKYAQNRISKIKEELFFEGD